MALDLKLTPDQIAALRTLILKNPRTWKAVIRNLWAHSDRVSGAYETALYTLRHTPGFLMGRITTAQLSEHLNPPARPLVDNDSARRAVDLAAQAVTFTPKATDRYVVHYMGVFFDLAQWCVNDAQFNGGRPGEGNTVATCTSEPRARQIARLLNADHEGI